MKRQLIYTRFVVIGLFILFSFLSFFSCEDRQFFGEMKTYPEPISPSFEEKLCTQNIVLEWKPVIYAEKYLVYFKYVGSEEYELYNSEDVIEPRFEIPQELAAKKGEYYEWYIVAVNDFMKMSCGQGCASRFTIVDCNPPEASIIKPKENSVYEQGSLFEFTGVSSDDVGVFSITKKLEYWDDENSVYEIVPDSQYDAKILGTDLNDYEKQNGNYSLIEQAAEGETLQGPFTFDASTQKLKPGKYKFTVKICDEEQNCTEKTVIFYVKADDIPVGMSGGGELFPANDGTLETQVGFPCVEADAESQTDGDSMSGHGNSEVNNNTGGGSTTQKKCYGDYTLPDWWDGNFVPSENYICADGTFTLSWGAVGNAVGYQVVMSKMDDLDFENPVLDTEVTDPEVVLSIPPIINAQGYVWKVRAKFGEGSYGTWSGVYIYKTVDLDKPVNQKPDIGFETSDNKPMLIWSGVAGATQYQIEFSSNSSFTDIVYIFYANDSTFIVSQGLTPGDYYWRVFAVNSRCFSEASDPFTLKISNIEVPPLLLTCDNHYCHPPLIKWNPVPAAQAYHFQISNSPAVDSNGNFTGTDPVLNRFDEGVIPSLSYLPTPDPLPRGWYYFHVRATTGSYYTDYTPICAFFQAGIDNPTNLMEQAEWSVDNQETCNEFPNFKWSAVNGAEKYTLQIANSSDFMSIVQQHDILDPYPTMPPYDPAPTPLTYTLTTPLPFGTYYWRIITTPDNETAGATCSTKTSVAWKFYMKRIQKNASILTNGAVDLVSLTDGTVTCDTTLNFTWNSVVGADANGYEIEIDTDNNFGSGSKWNLTGLGLSTTFTTLSPNDTYFWHVRGYNNKCTGEWSDTWSFRKEGVDLQTTLTSTEPNVSGAVDPATVVDSCDTLLTFKWGTVENAEKYQVQISQDSNFTTTLSDTIENGYANTDFSYNFSVYGTYYWRVRAWDEESAANCPGAWSDYRTINIRHIYLLTTLSSPISDNHLCQVKPSLNWTAIPGLSVTKYHIQVSDNIGFIGDTSGSSPYLWELTVNGNGSTNAIMDTNLLPDNKKYWWRVRGENAWCIGSYTAPATFMKEGVDDTTNLTSMEPDLTSSVNTTPSMDTCETDITFKWQTVNNATRYEIEIAKDATFATMEHETILVGASNTQFTYSFTAYGTYYWRVRGWDDEVVTRAACSSCPGCIVCDDCEGTWSAVRQVNIRHVYHVLDNVYPALLQPTDASKQCTLTPTFVWEAIPSASTDRYKIEVADNLAFDTNGNTSGSPYYWTTTTVIASGNTSATISANLLPDNRTYYWRVRGENNWCQGEYAATPFSFEKKGINVTDMPTLHTPASDWDTCNSSFSFIWNPVINATRYEIEIYSNSLMSSYVGGGIVSGATNTSYAFNPAIPTYGTYYWQVRALDDEVIAACKGPWSSPAFFAHIVRVDNKPTLNNPTPIIATVPNVKLCALRPTFSWTTVVGAKRYTIQISDNVAFTGTDSASPFLWEATTTNLTTTMTVDLLENNKFYYWRVRGENDEEAVHGPSHICIGQFSNYSTFEKKGINPVSGPYINVIPALTSPPDGQNYCTSTYNCVWTQVTNASRYQIQIAKNNFDFSSTSVDTTLSGAATTSYSFNAGAAPTYGTYYWRVRGLDSENDATCKGDWSTPTIFTNILRIDQIPIQYAATPNQSVSPVVVCTLRPTLKWSNVTGETKFRLQVADNLAFDTNGNLTGTPSYFWEKIVPADTTANPVQITMDQDLAPTNRQYYWRVRGENDEENPFICNGEWQVAPADFFKKGVNQIDIPNLLDPDDNLNSCDASYLCKWTQVTNAQRYQIQISTDGSDFDPSTVYTIVSGATNTSYNFNPPVPKFGTYFWRVRAGDDEDMDYCAGDWSTERLINILRIDEIAVLQPPTYTVSVAGDVTTICTRTPTFTWSKATGANHYVVEVSKNVDCSSPYWTYDMTVLTTATGPFSTTMNVDLENINTTYYWRVKGYNDEKVGAVPSVVCQGDYQPSPYKQILKKGVNDVVNSASLSPADGYNSCDSSFTVQWDPIDNATRYQIQISKDITFSTTLINNSNWLGHNNTTYTHPDGGPAVIPFYGTYYWRVRGWDDEVNVNCTSDWAVVPIRYINVLRIDQKPTLNNPTPTIATAPNVIVCTRTPGFSWTNITGETKFVIEVADNIGFDTNGNTVSSPFYWRKELGADVLSTTLDVNLLQTNKQYWWRVRGENHEETPDVCYGDWQTATFLKKGVNDPIPGVDLQPVDDFTLCGTTYNLVWNSVTNATRYHLQISKDDSTFGAGLIYDNNNYAPGTNTSYTLDRLATQVFGTYYWRVRPRDDETHVDCEPTWAVGTTVHLNYHMMEFIPTLNYPTPNLTTVPSVKICTRTPTFSWTKTYGADEYQVQVSKVSNFATTTWNKVVAVSTSAAGPFSTTMDISLDTANTHYYWRVRGYNDSNAPTCWGTYSATSEFDKVGINDVVNKITPLNASTTVCDGTPQFTWDTVANATSYDIEVSIDNFSSIYKSHNIAGGASTSFEGSPLLIDYSSANTYYWRIRGNDSTATCEGDWGTTWTFSQKGPNQEPVLDYPTNNLTVCDLTPTFRWSRVLGGTNVRYEIWVDNNADLLSPEYHTTDITTLDTDTNYVINTPGANLPNGVPLWWQVRVYNDDCPSAAMYSQKFQLQVVELVQPVITGPADGTWFCNPEPSNGTSPGIFRWNAIAGAADYVLQISDNIGFSTTGTVKTFSPGHAGFSGTSFNCTTDCDLSITTEGVWYWRVAGHNVTCTGPYSNNGVINVHDMDLNLSRDINYIGWNTCWCSYSYNYLYSNGTYRDDVVFCSPSVQLKWTTSEYGATKYRIQVSRDGTFTSPVGSGGDIEVDDLINAVGGNENTYNTPDLDLRSVNYYYWRVRAEDPTSGCISDWALKRSCDTARVAGFYINTFDKPTVTPLTASTTIDVGSGGCAGLNCNICPVSNDQYTINWDAPTTGTVSHYRLLVKQNGTTIVDDSNRPPTPRTYNLSLPDGNDFTIQVHAWYERWTGCIGSNNCSGPWSDTYNVHIYKDAIPQYVSPPDGEEVCNAPVVQVTYTSATAGAVTDWDLQVAKVSDFSTTYISVTSYGNAYFNIPFTGLYPNPGEQTFWWRVKPHTTDGGCTHDWTTARTIFYARPGTPTITYPPDYYVTCQSKLVFQWPTPQDGVTDYRIRVCNDALCSSRYIEYPIGVQSNNYVASPLTVDGNFNAGDYTSVGNPGLTNGVWTWTLSGYNKGPSGGPTAICASNPEASRTLRVVNSAFITVPTNLQGVNNGDDTYTLSWDNIVENANLYNMDFVLQFSDDSSFTTTLFEDTVAGNSGPTLSYDTFPTQYNIQCRYYWRVKAKHISEAGCEGNWTGTEYVTTNDLQKPVNLNSVNNGDNSFDLSWDVMTDRTYEVKISPNSNFSAPVETYTPATNSQTTNIQDVQKCKYYWKVRAVSTIDPACYSNWTTPITVLTEPNVPINLQAIHNIDNSFHISWDALAGMDYEIVVAEDASYTVNAKTYTSDVAFIDTDPNNELNCTHYWKIRSYNKIDGTCTSNWSADQPVNSIPINLSTLKEACGPPDQASFRLEWTGPASDYTVEIDNDADFSSISETLNNVTSPAITSVSYNGGVIYYWRVRGSTGCVSEWNETGTFIYAAGGCP